MSQKASKKLASLSYFDVDRHDAGCACGLCNSNGKSYGTAIYDVSSVDPELLLSEDDLSDLLHQLDPKEVVYAPTEEASEEEAKAWVKMHGYEIV